MAKTHRMPGRAASGGALAPEPPRATRIQSESIRIRTKNIFFRKNFMLSLLRRTPSKDLYQVLREGSSYTRFLMRELSTQETPPEGRVSFDQLTRPRDTHSSDLDPHTLDFG
mmetsp:Transcript_13942/g.11576  ORF Transcript_13942/g.11576 Transcript_13942/m.11576 type:complete len:112 (+) Transcript_13942:55-390(+)